MNNHLAPPNIVDMMAVCDGDIRRAKQLRPRPIIPASMIVTPDRFTRDGWDCIILPATKVNMVTFKAIRGEGRNRQVISQVIDATMIPTYRPIWSPR